MSLSVKASIISILLIFLTACGFHLRGSVTLPEQMATTYIQDSIPNSLILPRLKRVLIKNDINIINKINKVSDKPREQTSFAVLQLSNERFNRRQLSSGSSTLIKEYELNYAITFSLHKQSLVTQNKDILLAKQTINITREQTFDEAQVLAKTTEQQKLKQEMMRDAVRQILRQLQSIQNTNVNSNANNI